MHSPFTYPRINVPHNIPYTVQIEQKMNTMMPVYGGIYFT